MITKSFDVRLFFYAPEVRDAIWTLDHMWLPQRTLAGWLATGLVSASLRWTDKAPRTGFKARGRANACRFTVDDFALVRLVAQLRYTVRLSVDETKGVIDRIGPELRRILRGKSAAILVVDPVSRSVKLRSRAGGPDLDVRASQYVLDLAPLMEGNEDEARKRRVIGGRESWRRNDRGTVKRETTRLLHGE